MPRSKTIAPVDVLAQVAAVADAIVDQVTPEDPSPDVNALPPLPAAEPVLVNNTDPAEPAPVLEAVVVAQAPVDLIIDYSQVPPGYKGLARTASGSLVEYL